MTGSYARGILAALRHVLQYVEAMGDVCADGLTDYEWKTARDEVARVKAWLVKRVWKWVKKWERAANATP